MVNVARVSNWKLLFAVREIVRIPNERQAYSVQHIYKNFVCLSVSTATPIIYIISMQLSVNIK